MPRCNINLAKGIIWPRRRRVLAYRIIVIYLAIMLLILIFVCVNTFSRVKEGANYMLQSQAIEKKFASQHPNTPDIMKHARSLKEDIESDSARIASISSMLPESVHSILPALILLANQPDQRMLNKLSLIQPDTEPTQIFLELMSPQAASRNGSPSQDFIQKWQDSPLLAENFSTLEPTRSYRETIRGKAVSITQYEATGKD